MNYRSPFALFCLVTIALLSACGGGGGGTDATATNATTNSNESAKYVGNWQSCVALKSGSANIVGSIKKLITLSQLSGNNNALTLVSRREYFDVANCEGNIAAALYEITATLVLTGTQTTGGKTVDKVQLDSPAGQVALTGRPGRVTYSQTAGLSGTPTPSVIDGNTYFNIFFGKGVDLVGISSLVVKTAKTGKSIAYTDGTNLSFGDGTAGPDGYPNALSSTDLYSKTP